MTDLATNEEIRCFERRGFATWPAFEVVSLAGWELRFADGFTGRSNSVQVLESAPVDASALDVRIEHCVRRYRERGLSPRFKLTRAARPEGLDARLAEQGFERVSATRVQTLSLHDTSCEIASGVRLERRPNEVWIEASTRLNGHTGSAAASWRAIVERIERPLCASVVERGETRAVGLGALYDGWLFMGSIATAELARGRGHASALVNTLLATARRAGATGGWLQVTEDNAPALALYHRLGFRDLYDYWYRVPERGLRPPTGLGGSRFRSGRRR